MGSGWGRVVKFMVSPWRHPKTGVFYFRQAVPAALREPVATILGRPGKPTWELKWSLRTHDLREAKARMPDALKKAAAILDAARKGARALTEREAHALAGLWYQRKARQWESNPNAADEWAGFREL